jgi:tRNA threonylcarbamoyladenosine biosynthesis protein TsaE
VRGFPSQNLLRDDNIEIMKEFCIENIDEIAGRVLQSVKKSTDHATVIALSGDLGAGKTTLTQTLGRILGVEENMISPTFVIMKRYKLRASNWNLMIHIDAYRLKDEKELEVLGWQEMIENPDNLILIEWPERVSNIIPKHAYNISLGHVDEKTRSIDF